MGQRGPKPKPTLLKALDGNPGNRHLNVNEVQPQALTNKPEFIHGAAGKEWERVVNSMPPGFFTEADIPVLSIYCMAWVLYRNALATIAREGTQTAGSTGQTVAHPSLAVASKQAELILKTADRLGMSPAARTRLEMPENQTTMGKFQGLIGVRTT